MSDQRGRALLARIKNKLLNVDKTRSVYAILISSKVSFRHALILFSLEGRLGKKLRVKEQQILSSNMFSRFVRPQTACALHNSSKNFGTSTQVAIFAHSVFQNLRSRFARTLLDHLLTWTVFKDNLLRGLCY